VEVALADAVAVVRDELLAAAARGAGSDVVFEVEQVQLEFTVELRQETGAKAGFKAWVVSGETGRSSAGTRGHRVAVTLHPRRRGGSGEVLVAGDKLRQDGPGDVTGHLGRR
jgi:hypothetical protein